MKLVGPGPGDVGCIQIDGAQNCFCTKPTRSHSFSTLPPRYYRDILVDVVVVLFWTVVECRQCETKRLCAAIPAGLQAETVGR